MQHKMACPTLTFRSVEELLVWYAYLDLRVSRDSVNYRCPECGLKLSMPLEEFLEHDSSLELRCSDCRGDREERGGAMCWLLGLLHTALLWQQGCGFSYNNVDPTEQI